MRGLSGLFGRRAAAEPGEMAGRRRRSWRAAPSHAEPSIDLARLSAEIEGVAGYVARLRREIAFLRGNEIYRDRLPSARNDVGDARDSMQSSVTRILTACETMLAAPELSPEAYRATIEEHVLAIMEACGFEDITGQRLARVAFELAYAERRLQRFALAVGIADGEPPLDRRPVEEQIRRELLLQGPQRLPAAPDQAAIDAVFA